MIMRREGNVLHITDNGFYEPPVIPSAAKRRRSRMFWSLGIVAVLTAIGFGLAGANKLQRFL